jgi:hypothetical protein
MSDELDNRVILNGEEVSLETPKIGAEPAAPKKRDLWWLRLMLRYPIWTFMVIVGGGGAILSSAWQPLERYFPKLNEFIHSDVTDENDAKYQIFKMQESAKSYKSAGAVCDDPKASFETCRASLIAAEPALNDISARVGKLNAAWNKELAQGTMPEVCVRAGSQVYGAYNEYIFREKQILSAIKNADSKSQASMAALEQTLDTVGPAESKAIDNLANLPPWPSECANY